MVEPPRKLSERFQRSCTGRPQIKLARLGALTSMQDLQEIRGNRFEKLKGERQGQYSIRINDQYRICFKWEKENAVDVEIVDYH